MKHLDQEDTLEETYDELENDLLCRIEGIQNQIQTTQDKRDTIIWVNRVAQTALEVFNDILNKPKLDRNDFQLIIEKSRVYEDHIEVQIKADIDSILRCGELPEELLKGAEQPEAAMSPINIPLNRRAADNRPYKIQIIQESDKHDGKIFAVNVICESDERNILHFLIVADLGRMIFEGVELEQRSIPVYRDNLLVLDRMVGNLERVLAILVGTGFFTALLYFYRRPPSMRGGGFALPFLRRRPRRVGAASAFPAT